MAVGLRQRRGKGTFLESDSDKTTARGLWQNQMGSSEQGERPQFPDCVGNGKENA